MRTVWRITTARFAASAFSGEGARLYGGRWNSKGHAVIYTAESQSLALLEMLVQDEPLRARYVLIPAHLPADVAVSHVEASALPADWRTLGTRDALQAIGRAWLEEGTSAVLAAPSAVVPAEHSYLLNPRHPDFARIVIGEPKALDADVRLLRNLRGNS
ncbi:RES family NAD+ phosphorylase [Thauera sp.]|uniref:RES family NAD+ phosphorylase n=1 Tax=Thauera sp. TaxID=1905334 RepID=UPI001B4B020F|nr:RES family NAD+ phosphorylase [Thauera sp.]MBP6131921.1 RES family NAD+ phosphorylase [Thauera sp.]